MQTCQIANALNRYYIPLQTPEAFLNLILNVSLNNSEEFLSQIDLFMVQNEFQIFNGETEGYVFVLCNNGLQWYNKAEIPSSCVKPMLVQVITCENFSRNSDCVPEIYIQGWLLIGIVILGILFCRKEPTVLFVTSRDALHLGGVAHSSHVKRT